MLFLLFCSVLLGLIITCTIHWCYVMKWSEFGRLINKIPGPPPVPVVGNAAQVMRHSDPLTTLFLDKWVKQYGGIYKTCRGTDVLVAISSPDYIEKLLTSRTLLAKNYLIGGDWLGESILILTGQKWKARRRLLTPAFHFHILNDFFDVFNKESNILVEQLEKARCSNSNGELDICPYVTRCILDIICETSMGVSVNAQTEDSDYVEAVDRICHLIATRWMKPWLLPDVVFYLTSYGQKYRRCIETLHGFTDRVIAERKKQFDRKQQDENNDGKEDGLLGGKKKRAFLDLLLQSKQDGADLSEQEIRNEVNTIMFGGHDTNSSALSWFLYLMAKHPEEQDKVYAEIKEIFGDSDRPCSSHEASNLKYLECCIKETLRLYPPVPAVHRKATEDITFGEYTVPAGCTMAVCTYAVHRNPQWFPEPESFKPERFLPENSVGRHPFCFIPFSAGPRNCIGQRFAFLEQKVVLSTVLRRFKFELCPETKVTPVTEVVLKSKTGILLRITPRC